MCFEVAAARRDPILYCFRVDGFASEMFLDSTDLSKTVERHETNRCHVLPHSSRFFAAVLLEWQPLLVERGPILAINS